LISLLIAELNLNDIKGPGKSPRSTRGSTRCCTGCGLRTGLELMVAVRPTFHNPALLAKQAGKISTISAMDVFR